MTAISFFVFLKKGLLRIYINSFAKLMLEATDQNHRFGTLGQCLLVNGIFYYFF